MGSPRWVPEINLLRGLAILGVVLDHCCMFFNKFEEVTLLSYSLISISVGNRIIPLFVIISGFILTMNSQGGIREGFLKRRFMAVVPPYLFFSGVYLSIGHLVDGPLTASEAVFRVITGNVAHHMWFIVVILQLYIVFPYLVRAYDRFNSVGRSLHFLVIVLGGQVLYNSLAAYLAAGSDSEMFSQSVGRLFVGTLFYFVLGIHILRHYRDFRTMLGKIDRLVAVKMAMLLVILALISGHLWIREYLQHGEFYGQFSTYRVAIILIDPCFALLFFPLCFALVLRAWGTSGLWCRVLDSLGNVSYGIYLSHMLAIYALVIAWGMLGVDFFDWYLYPILFISSVMLCYVVMRIIAPLPFSRYLIGNTKKREKFQRTKGPIG